MMTPSIFGENLFDEFFDDFFDFPGFDRRDHGARKSRLSPAPGLMRTDVKECGDHYEVDVELPGFQKEELSLELKDGNLVIRGVKNQSHDETDRETGKFVRRERFVGSMSRSFYVGDAVKQEDIRAKYENGVLKLSIPRLDERKPAVPEKKFIAIEG